MIKSDIETFAKSMKVGMFADRKTVQEAYDYAVLIAKASGRENQAGVITAIHVLMNTISKTLLEIIGVDNKEIQEKDNHA